jgi:hypothetical protein
LHIIAYALVIAVNFVETFTDGSPKKNCISNDVENFIYLASSMIMANIVHKIYNNCLEATTTKI